MIVLYWIGYIIVGLIVCAAICGACYGVAMLASYSQKKVRRYAIHTLGFGGDNVRYWADGDTIAWTIIALFFFGMIGGCTIHGLLGVN